MIENLPKEITYKDLESFNFGNIEANDDELLLDSICRTASIIEFLGGKKSIVLGEKGTGKTAIFRLIKENKLTFQQKNGCKNLVITVDDNFQYKNIKGKILKLINTDTEDIGYQYQVVWELFLFYKVLQGIQNLDIRLSDLLLEAKKLVGNVLNTNGIDSFLKNKTTFSVKLYNADSFFLPEASISSEPINLDCDVQGISVEKLEIDLDKYKAEADKFLKENNYNAIVLIDRLDEFVSKSSTQVQDELLQALIAVDREYGKYKNIDIKFFLRDDLFEQLSFENIGGFDKVVSKKVNLKWTPENTREFISKRIISNYKNVFAVDNLGVTVNSRSLKIDTSLDNKRNKKPRFWKRMHRRFISKFNPDIHEQKFPRKVSLDDDISKQLILTIFPNHVCFRKVSGEVETISVFDFFSLNFNLATGNTIPRLILIFLENIMTVTKEYYLKNRDLLPIKHNENNNFEIIKEGFFEEAYSLFKEDIYLNFSKLNPEFEQAILLFKEKIGNKYSFRAKDLKNIINITEDEDLYNFCNYMTHIGFFKRTNGLSSIEEMKFELPPIFRREEKRREEKKKRNSSKS